MNERCPKCAALNTRVRHEYELHGWLKADDYCGVCGKNWPRPDARPRSSVESIDQCRDAPSEGR